MKLIPPDARILKDHPCSKVWLYDGHIYKWQPKFLTENEIWCLEEIYYSGYVPFSEQVGLEIIRMEIVKDESPTNAALFLDYCLSALRTLKYNDIRHGDLTRPNILVRGNRPILIDFAESRLATDPRPDKRPGGDEFWLKCTAQEILIESS